MLPRLVKLIISLSVACADRFSVSVRRLFGGQPATNCVVLYYHAVRAAERRRFASQMDELARLSIPTDIEGMELLEKGCRYSAVTFDDAFISVVENALPELRARNIPCTIFVPTGSIGHHPSWIRPSHKDAAEVVASVSMLQAIAAQPLVRIGSHSVSHPDFRRLGDGEARDELSRSKAVLEEILGQEVTSFSFPHGTYTRRSLDLASKCGYARVFTIDPVQLKDPRAELAIGRVRAEPHDWPIEFHLKVLGAYRWMAPVSALKQGLLAIIRGSRAQGKPAGQGI